jgi:hypothetical protein
MTPNEIIASRTSAVMEDPQRHTLATTNRPRSIEHSDEMSLFYQVHPKAGSVRLQYVTTSKGISLEPFEEFLQANGWECVRSHEQYRLDEGRQGIAWRSWVHSTIPAMIMYEGSSRGRMENIRVRGRMSDPMIEIIEEKPEPLGDVLIVEGIRMISSISVSTKESAEMWEKLLNTCRENRVPLSTTPRLGIISHDGSDYYVKNFSLEGKTPSFEHADLHYGEGFIEFHEALLKRLTDETKGLVLLHGEPGTGKTQYIRVLLDKLGVIGKSVLYVPPSFSAQMTEPGMIEFISDWIIDEERDCILLIEDAEPLLEIRNGADGRTTGISNLLNMTDGLLNDILGLTVIATFNTSIGKIDPALLRPQRLLARKEFYKISRETAEKLSTAIGINTPEIEYPASLAEFYTVKKSASILIHQVEKNEKKIGFK